MHGQRLIGPHFGSDQKPLDIGLEIKSGIVICKSGGGRVQRYKR